MAGNHPSVTGCDCKLLDGPLLLNEVMNAGISGVTYYIYKKTVFVRDCACLLIPYLAQLPGKGDFTTSGRRQSYKCSLFLWYFIGASGLVNIRDGWFFEAVGKKVLRRHCVVGCRSVFAALDPRVTLQCGNQMMLELGEGETASEIYDRSKENAEPNLEMLFTPQKTIVAIGHCDLCYKGRIISSETTIRIVSNFLERWGWGS